MVFVIWFGTLVFFLEIDLQQFLDILLSRLPSFPAFSFLSYWGCFDEFYLHIKMVISKNFCNFVFNCILLYSLFFIWPRTSKLWSDYGMVQKLFKFIFGFSNAFCNHIAFKYWALFNNRWLYSCGTLETKNNFN